MVHPWLLSMLGAYSSHQFSSSTKERMVRTTWVVGSLDCRQLGLSVALAWQELDAKEDTLIQFYCLYSFMLSVDTPIIIVSQKMQGKGEEGTHSESPPSEKIVVPPYYLNFNLKSKDGPLNNEWVYAFEKGSLFLSNLTIRRVGQCPELYYFMLFHRNLVKGMYQSQYLHLLYKSLFQKEFREETIALQWPLVKGKYPSFIEKLDLDALQIQFFTKEDGEYQQWILKDNDIKESFIEDIDQNIEIILEKGSSDEIKVTILYPSKKGNRFGKMVRATDQAHLRNVKKTMAENVETIADIVQTKTKNQGNKQDYEQFPYFHEASFLVRNQIRYEILYKEKYNPDHPKNSLETKYDSYKSWTDKIWTPNYGDIHIEQGDLGNCYFIAAMDQILTKADFILDRVIIYEMQRQDHLCIILNIDGRYTIIPITFELDKMDKDSDGNIFKFARFSKVTHLPKLRNFKCVQRALLVEKALATIFKGYQRLRAGWSSETFMAVTSHNTTSYELYDKKNQIKYVLSNLRQQQIINIMQTWTDELNQIMVKLKKTGAVSYNQNTGSTSYPLGPRELEERYHLITISAFDKQVLKTMFNNYQNWSFKNYKIQFEEHAYSFQGIEFVKQSYVDIQSELQDNLFSEMQKTKQQNNSKGKTHQKQSLPNKQIKKGFVRLRDPRGSVYPEAWRKQWSIKHNYKPYEDKKNGKIIFNIDGTQISCCRNEFFLRLEDLFGLFPLMEVCIYNPNAKYHSKSVYIERLAASAYNLHIQESGLHYVTLHHRNKRHDIILEKDKKKSQQQLKKQDKEILQKGISLEEYYEMKDDQTNNSWKYPYTRFKLKFIGDRNEYDFSAYDPPEQLHLLFLNHDTSNMTAQFQFYFKFLNKQKYKLEIEVDQNKDLQQYVLSILSHPFINFPSSQSEYDRQIQKLTFEPSLNRIQFSPSDSNSEKLAFKTTDVQEVVILDSGNEYMAKQMFLINKHLEPKVEALIITIVIDITSKQTNITGCDFDNFLMIHKKCIDPGFVLSQNRNDQFQVVQVKMQKKTSLIQENQIPDLFDHYKVEYILPPIKNNQHFLNIEIHHPELKGQNKCQAKFIIEKSFKVEPDYGNKYAQGDAVQQQNNQKQGKISFLKQQETSYEPVDQ